MENAFQNKKVVTMAGAMLALLLAALDQTIVATAMPEIVRELNGLSHLSWVFSAYMLASTVTIPIYGKLSDIYGRRIFYIIGIVLFLVGSALCGIAGSMTALIFFRGIQGLGAGAIMVNSFAVIGDLFPPAERGKWQGLFGAVFGLSSVIGPLLGGWLTDNASWRFVFYINIPLGLLALGFIYFTMPVIKNLRKQPIDYLGALLIATTLIPLLLALVWGGSTYAWNSDLIKGLLTVALTSFVLFIYTEQVAADPILPLHFFRNRVFAISAFIVFITAIGMFGAILYLPLFAQGVIGFSATYAGLALTPMMFGIVTASVVSGQLVSRTGKYKLVTIVGIAFIVLGMYLLSRMTVDTTKLQLIINMIVTGLGLGVSLPIFNIIVQSSFGNESLGVVTASMQLFRSIGGTVGTALLGGLLNTELAKRLINVQNESFVQMASQSGKHIGVVDNNNIQAFLTPKGRNLIEQSFANTPTQLHVQIQAAFDHFVHTLQIAFSGALSEIYLISTVVVGMALVVVFFLPEIPLRKTNKPLAQEIGMELDESLGNFDASREPRFQG